MFPYHPGLLSFNRRRLGRRQRRPILNDPPHDELVLAGDFNAVTGSGMSGFEQVAGFFGRGIPNDNNVRLLTRCALLGLTTVGSWFIVLQHKRSTLDLYLKRRQNA